MCWPHLLNTQLLCYLPLAAPSDLRLTLDTCNCSSRIASVRGIAARGAVLPSCTLLREGDLRVALEVLTIDRGVRSIQLTSLSDELQLSLSTLLQRITWPSSIPICIGRQAWKLGLTMTYRNARYFFILVHFMIKFYPTTTKHA